MTAPVLVEIQGNVMIMTLNRPEAKNAATAEMAELMVKALDELEARADLSVGVITGAGGTFCSGMDLKDFVKGRRPSIPGRGFLGLSEKPPRKVLIAAVEGYALAGGFETVLSCDLIVASKASKFGLPETKRGLAAGAGGAPTKCSSSKPPSSRPCSPRPMPRKAPPPLPRSANPTGKASDASGPAGPLRVRVRLVRTDLRTSPRGPCCFGVATRPWPAAPVVNPWSWTAAWFGHAWPAAAKPT